MRINRDSVDNPIVPDYVLCKANRERIGTLQCTGKTIEYKFNDLDEVNFATSLYMDDEKNPYYDAVDFMKYILLPDVGFFTVTSMDRIEQAIADLNGTMFPQVNTQINELQVKVAA